MKYNTGVSGQLVALQVVIKGARFIPPCGVCLLLGISRIVAKKEKAWRITCGRSGHEGSPGTGYTWLSSTFHCPKLCYITTSNCKNPGKCSLNCGGQKKKKHRLGEQLARKGQKDQDYNLTYASNFSVFESLNSLEMHLASKIILCCFRGLQKALVPQSFMSQCTKNSARGKEIRIGCLWDLQEDGWGSAMHRELPGL